MSPRRKKSDDEELQRLVTYVPQSILENLREKYPAIPDSVAARMVLMAALKDSKST